MKPLEALQDFLLEHFREVDVRRLARSCSERGEIGASLPGRPVDREELVFAAVEAFHRHGAIDEHFWQHLHKARPKLTAKIAALQALFLAAPATSVPLRLVITRIHEPQFRPFLEVEFVLRNDGAVAQIVQDIHVTARNVEVDYRMEARIAATLDHGKFRFLVINNGWGSASFDGVVSVRHGKRVETHRIMLPKVASGERAVGWEARYQTWDLAMEVRGTLQNLVTKEVIQVHEDTTVFDSRLFGGPHQLPDTTYVCILDAERAEQHRVYRTLRTIAPGEIDVFQCAVSATKAARFDFTVDIVIAGDVRLTTHHPGLSVWRDAQEGYEFDSLVDGAIFVRGPDNVWRLADPTGAPWRALT